MPKSRRVNANFDDDGDGGDDGEDVFVEAFEVDIGDVTMATPGAKYGGHGCARSGINDASDWNYTGCICIHVLSRQGHVRR